MKSVLNGPSSQHYITKILSIILRETQYNWKGLKLPVSIKKIDKFEENNPGIAVNVLFSNNKKSKYIYIPQVRT